MSRQFVTQPLDQPYMKYLDTSYTADIRQKI